MKYAIEQTLEDERYSGRKTYSITSRVLKGKKFKSLGDILHDNFKKDFKNLC